jgi:hypothetical protein
MANFITHNKKKRSLSELERDHLLMFEDTRIFKEFEESEQVKQRKKIYQQSSLYGLFPTSLLFGIGNITNGVNVSAGNEYVVSEKTPNLFPLEAVLSSEIIYSLQENGEGFLVISGNGMGVGRYQSLPITTGAVVLDFANGKMYIQGEQSIYKTPSYQSPFSVVIAIDQTLKIYLGTNFVVYNTFLTYSSNFSSAYAQLVVKNGSARLLQSAKSNTQISEKFNTEINNTGSEKYIVGGPSQNMYPLPITLAGTLQVVSGTGVSASHLTINSIPIPSGEYPSNPVPQGSIFFDFSSENQYIMFSVGGVSSSTYQPNDGSLYYVVLSIDVNGYIWGCLQPNSMPTILYFANKHWNLDQPQSAYIQLVTKNSNIIWTPLSVEGQVFTRFVPDYPVSIILIFNPI